ncbi:MAG: VOC family protein [Tumebacillaceae bacterium]
MANPVVHFEIIGNNGANIQEYYAKLFGWEINADNPMNYGLVGASEGGIGGGIGGSEEGGKPHVTFYVAVEDLQATLDKAVELGGKVVQPVTEIPGMVTLAQFSDIDGNIIGIIKNQM